MKVLLHIGSNKTGTSSLQSIFSKSREYLQQKGVLYPYASATEPTHATLLTGLFHPERRPRVDPIEKPRSVKQRQQFVKELGCAIQRHAPRTLILSSEGFFRRLADGALESFRKELYELGATEIEVVAYLRRPSHKYLSSLQQKIKASHRLLPPAFPNYREVLTPYLEVFGKDRLKVRCFDPKLLVDGDIIADFVKSYLADSGIELTRLATLGRSNETVSAESMDIVRQHRMDFFPKNDNQFKLSSTRLLQQLMVIEKSVGLGRPTLKSEIADAVDYSSKDALWLRDEFGVIFPQYDYARIEAGALTECVFSADALCLEDIVQIDRMRQGKLIEALATSGWTTGFAWRDLPRQWVGHLPSRSRWVAGLSKRLASSV